ncbi:MAG: aspartate/glutamate racemase family protein [Gammaproteobacteria bacterium]|nr:aspartate/glutamate racemase family protein [Gammaproteobacteria bacterium]
MKTIGLLGGMSWHSTELYYRLLNEGVQQRLGGLHSARILLASVDFAEIAELQATDQWEQAGYLLAGQAQKLELAGADFLLIGTNTMHISVPQIEREINIPILHIADATADAIIKAGYHSTGLLGTKFTMQMDYYKQRLIDRGLKVLVPDDPSCIRINDVIFDELCYGEIKPASKQDYLNFIQQLVDKGAECIIAGCTEITLLVQQADTEVRLFDTTAIHAQAAVYYALAEDD